MKDVHIIEKLTGKVVATIPIQMSARNYTPSREEYEAAAWEAAADDGLVDPDRVSDYTLEVEDVSAAPSPTAK
jgi:hypothetical protein